MDDILLKRTTFRVDKERGSVLLGMIEADVIDLYEHFNTPLYVVINQQDLLDVAANLSTGGDFKIPETIETEFGRLNVVVFDHNNTPKVVGLADKAVLK